MAYSSEAYDFSLFEERVGNTASAVRREKEEVIQPKVVELPQKKQEQRPKVKLRPLQLAAAVMSFALVFSVLLSVVYSQLRLTELTEEINTATRDLARAQSLEVQLTMQASQRMNSAEVEKYAQEELGMSKMNEGQIKYINVAQEDRGTVMDQSESDSFWESIEKFIKSFFE